MRSTTAAAHFQAVWDLADVRQTSQFPIMKIVFKHCWNEKLESLHPLGKGCPTCQNISNISRGSAVLAHGPRGPFHPHFLQHRLSRTCPFSSSWCRCRHFSTPNTAPNLRWPMFGSLLSICNSDLEDLTTWRRSLDNPLLISFKSTFRLAKSRLQFVQGLNSVVLLFMYT